MKGAPPKTKLQILKSTITAVNRPSMQWKMKHAKIIKHTSNPSTPTHSSYEATLKSKSADIFNNEKFNPLSTPNILDFWQKKGESGILFLCLIFIVPVLNLNQSNSWFTMMTVMMLTSLPPMSVIQFFLTFLFVIG